MNFQKHILRQQLTPRTVKTVTLEGTLKIGYKSKCLKYTGEGRMPSLAFLDQFVAAYEEKRGPVPLVNGKNGPKPEKWAYLLRRRRV